MTPIDGWPRALGLRRHERLDSTNEEALRLARAGERGPLWVVASEQTAGRGRRGRRWVSQRGNLFATFLTEAQASASAQLGFAAALAAGETISRYVPASDVRLKWPNDVLLEGKKTAGILLETTGENVVAIGIGINLAHHPSGNALLANSVALIGGLAPHPDDALVSLARSMAAWYEVWRKHGFAPVRAAWISRAAGLGCRIQASIGQSEMQGVFEDIDLEGALLLRDGGTLHRVTAGDVFFRS